MELNDKLNSFMKGMLPLFDIRTVMPDNSQKIEVVSKPGMCPYCKKEKVGLDNTHSDNTHYRCAECGAIFQLKSYRDEPIVDESAIPMTCTSLTPVNQWR